MKHFLPTCTPCCLPHLTSVVLAHCWGGRGGGHHSPHQQGAGFLLRGRMEGRGREPAPSSARCAARGSSLREVSASGQTSLGSPRPTGKYFQQCSSWLPADRARKEGQRPQGQCRTQKAEDIYQGTRPVANSGEDGKRGLSFVRL